MEQRSAEWFQARLGKITASRIADIVTITDEKIPTAKQSSYMMELIAERLSGKITEKFTTQAMNFGVENEPIARAQYEIMTGEPVELVGFVPHPTIEQSGASPDGLVGMDGLIEIKCPTTITHTETLLSDKIKPEYIYQMQWQMECTGRQWCDFVSFDPRMPERYSTFIKRIPRDDEKIEKIKRAVITFLNIIESNIEKINNKF